MKLSRFVVAMGLCVSMSAFAGAKKLHGVGEWRLSTGASGSCDSHMTVEKVEENAYEVTSAFDCSNFQQSVQWTAVMAADQSFTMMANGQEIGSGYCFGVETEKISCHLNANVQGYAAEETIHILNFGETIYKIGSVSGGGYTGFWSETLAE